MKQYINSKQLKELTPDKFRNLCKLAGDKYYYDSTDEQINKAFQNEYLTMYISILEKTNIGQMIEILYSCDIDIMSNYYKENEWTITFYKDEHYIFRNVKLCDALWEAVKEIL